MIKSDFSKNILKLVTGTALSQLLLILSTPVITRMFSPEMFGISGVFIAITSILMAISSLCTPFAIVLPRSNNIANRVAVFSLYISLFVAFFILVVILIDIYFNHKFFKIPFSSVYLFIIPFLCIAASVQQISERWLQRSSSFASISILFFIQTIIGILFRLIGGIEYNTYDILIMSFVSATIIHSILIYRSAHKRGLTGFLLTRENLIFSKTIIFRCKDFILYRFPQTLAFWLVQGIPVLIISSYYSNQLVGFYTLSATILAAPANLISKAVGDVIYPQLARMQNEGHNISQKIIKTTAILSIVGVIPLVFLLFFAPDLFQLFFGDVWYDAGDIARWLSIVFYCGFINAAVVQAVIVLKLQKQFFMFSIVSSAIKITSLIVPAVLGKTVITVIQLYSLSSVICVLYLIFYVIKQAKSR